MIPLCMEVRQSIIACRTTIVLDNTWESVWKTENGVGMNQDVNVSDEK